jgi:flagellar biosynthetic protein FlhB
MSENKSDQERTEEPTQRKLEKAREEGNVNNSKEISSLLLMLVSVIVFVAAGDFMYGRLKELFQTFFFNSGMALEDIEHAKEFLKMALRYGIEMMIPIMIILLLTAIFVNLIQTGAVFSTKSIKPKASKINPLSGLKRIFSLKGFVELSKGILKLMIVGLIAYLTVQSEIEHFVSFVIMPMEYNISEAGSHILVFVGRVLAALCVLSIADAIYQRYQYRKDLRMTKQEVKDEYKQMEGDPHIKGKRKKMGLSFRQQKRLDHAVLSSDVVVTNPTHYAVAIYYDPDKNDAPIVTAKGQRLRALKIKELAKKYGIQIVENKPVAQALYASAEEDEYIPEDLYRAVAEILAYVYKLKNKHKF